MFTMKINLIAFGIAKEIIQSKQLEVELTEGDTISSLKKKLFERYPDFSNLKSLSFAVGDNYEEDSFTLHNNDEVVIIPPVSGG
jgi:molybdopterin converting factor small subunit